MRHVLVVGGCGFIGSHLVRRLLITPGVERVCVFDNLSSGRRDYLPASDRLTFWEGNARDYDRLRAAMRASGCDTVFHLAANPDIARAVREPTIDFEQGTVLLKNTLEAMRVCGVRRIFYTSGSGVYGDDPEMVLHEAYGPMRPISTYGASKLGCEAMICAYCYMFGLEGRAFRFANVVGPRQTHGVGYDFLRKLRANPRRLPVLGNGQQRKSYIAVDDVLNAMFVVSEKVVGCYNVFNVATDDSLTVTRIAELACEVVGLDPASVVFEYTGGARGWKGDVPVVRFDCTRIRREGWVPMLTSEQAMRCALRAMWAELQAEGAAEKVA